MKYKTLVFLIVCVLACSFSSCRSVQLRDKHKTEKSDVVSKNGSSTLMKSIL